MLHAKSEKLWLFEEKSSMQVLNGYNKILEVWISWDLGPSIEPKNGTILPAGWQAEENLVGGKFSIVYFCPSHPWE